MAGLLRSKRKREKSIEYRVGQTLFFMCGRGNFCRVTFPGNCSTFNLFLHAWSPEELSNLSVQPSLEHERKIGLAQSSPVSSCLVKSYLVKSCLVKSCLVKSCLVKSCLVLSCLVKSCLVLSCLVKSCLVLSCLVKSCLVLSCPCAVLYFYLLRGLYHSRLPPLTKE